MMRKKITPIAAGVLLAIASQSAWAVSDVFRFVGHGPISAGMGGAGAAFNVGAPGMIINPATLSLMGPGSDVHVGTDVIFADLRIRNTATGEIARSKTHSNNRGPYAAPQIGYTYQKDALTLGVGIFPQGGVGTEYGSDSFLSRANGGIATGLENTSRLLTINIPFSASYQVNEKLAVGASIDAIWQGMNLGILLGADQVGSLIASGRADGSLVPVLGSLPDLRGAHLHSSNDHPAFSGTDAWGVGGRVGFIYRISQQTTLGGAYSFKSHIADMEGGATLTAVDALAGQVPLKGKVSIRDFQTPAQLNFGISHRINPQWMVVADVSRIFWKDAMKDIDLGFVADAGGSIDILFPLNFKDQTALSFGAAYQTGKWTLRGGGRLTTQALRPDTMLAVMPGITTRFGSAGFSYELSPSSKVDVTWTHSFMKKMDNSSLPNTSQPIRAEHAQDSIGLAYTYSF
jgi:long-chain fatty acid transport protein